MHKQCCHYDQTNYGYCKWEKDPKKTNDNKLKEKVQITDTDINYLKTKIQHITTKLQQTIASPKEERHRISLPRAPD